MLQAGMVLQNRYEIVKVIGQGGMSTVYQAKDLNTGILLAIKDVERAGKDSSQVVEQSLAAEGRMLIQLRNPHLPRIYDIIENSQNFMLVMDYIEGESLDKVIKREGAQPMDRVLDWGMQICEVFDYLHNQAQPIIYRDMKPANVMLQPNGQLMMIDFGTARTEKVGVAMQADTICIGTAGFAAPEQFGGIGQSTAKTDIFCLGATLYNMITGHSPCDRPQGILPLERWNPALANSPISYIINKCTRNDPDERYQTAAELYEDLRLARTGGFFNGKGRSGTLRRNGFQSQQVKSAGGGLSGLLGLSGVLPQKQAAPPQKPATPQNAWQAPAHAPAQRPPQPQRPAPQPVHYPAAPMQPVQVPQPPATQQQSSGIWRMLMLISVILSVVFVLFTVVMALLGTTLGACAFLVITVICAGMAVISLVMDRRS